MNILIIEGVIVILILVGLMIHQIRNNNSLLLNVFENVAESEYSINGNTAANRANGGWVAEQGDWLYFAIGDKILKENVRTGVKNQILQVSGSNCMYLNVMGSWLYFEIGTNKIARCRTDGQQYEELVLNVDIDAVEAWDAYNGNVYILIGKNISANKKEYYLAKVDWEKGEYAIIIDCGEKEIDNGIYYDGSDKNWFLGIENGYAYFLENISQKDGIWVRVAGLEFIRVNIENKAEVERITWMRDWSYCPSTFYIKDDYVYGFDEDFGFIEQGADDFGYVVANFETGAVNVKMLPLMNSYRSKRLTVYNFQGDNILSADWENLFMFDEQSTVRQINDEIGILSICFVQNKVYYTCWPQNTNKKYYCRINLDGTGWEEITADGFTEK